MKIASIKNTSPLKAMNKKLRQNEQGKLQGQEKDSVVLISKIPKFKIQENNPDDPMVSTKVLNHLSSNIIDFNQQQRDVISEILSKKAKEVLVKRAAKSE